METAQAAQTVTGNNIANAGTAGYTDESADIVQGPEGPVTGYDNPNVSSNYSGGSVVNTITRSREQYLDAEYRTANSNSTANSTLSSSLGDVQDSFNEPTSDGISGAISTFFTNVTDLQNSPSNIGVRTSVIDSGAALAQSIQTVQSNLTSNNSALALNVSDDMTQVNSLGTQIASLNQQIMEATAANQQPNSLLDQRDLLVDNLSKLANITATSTSNGAVNVAIGSTVLVSGDTSNTVDLATMQSRGDLTSGDIYGLTQAQGDIAGYQSNLNTLASTIVTQVNAVQSTGSGLDGTTGVPFFTATAGSEASTIAVNPTLQNDPSDLAAAAAVVAPATTPAAGDASNAVLLLNVSTTQQASLGNQTISNYFNGVVTALGNATSNAQTEAADTKATTTSLSNERSTIEGVSTDTEMTNMMIYQRAYQASAQFISTQNDMLNTLVNTMFNG